MSTVIDQALRAAKSALKTGTPVKAVQALLAALARFPGNARLLTALAEVQSARTGLPARPIGPAHLQRLLRVQAQSGPASAAEEARIALLLDPASPLGNGFFGSLLLELGRPDLAVPPLRIAVKHDPKTPGFGVNLSNSLRRCDLAAEAALVARAVLSAHPDLAAAQAALALALMDDGLPMQAVDVWAKMIKATPNSADLHFEAGRAYGLAQRPRLAIAAYETALQHDPSHFRTLNELGNAHLTAGDPRLAQAVFERAIAAHPDRAAGYYNLAQSITVQPGDPLIGVLQKLADRTLPPDDAVMIQQTLAKALEDCGESEASHQALERGKDLRRKTNPYDPDEQTRLIHTLKARHWSPKAQLAPPATDRRPVFIIGMMRSGTSLMEQILSAHPAVYGAGELDYLGKAVLSEMRKGDAPLDAAAMARIRAAYLLRLGNLPTDLPVITDKMPGNFTLIGVILRAFPEARIVHMRRYPIAVCWSIYKNYLGARLPFTNDLTDIAAYYDHYTDYMAFAEAQAPGTICHVDYAELTTTPEPVIRRVLDHCGLPFDSACLAPENNQRGIRTASFKQARSGIYQGSTNAWRGFEPYLKPLTDHFAAKPG